MVAADEVELKLELTSDGADALEGAGLFSDDPRVIDQHAIYFDTPDHDLSKAGLSLRIRRTGDVRVQTVKASGGAAAGMFVRSEWECQVADDTPLLDATTPISALLGDKVAAIARLFEVRNERRVWIHDGIEIALDRGRVVAGGTETPFCEVELEQKGCDPSALFALARRIDAIVPVHLGVLTKSERGYRLISAISGATKAEPIELSRTMDAGTAFQTTAHACLRHFRLNVPLLMSDQNPSALHQARVALRRFRSALSIFKPILADKQAVALNGEARWLAGELGKARDLDVLIERSERGKLQDRLLKAKAQAYDNAMVALQSDRARTLMLDAAEWIVSGAWLADADSQELRQLPAREYSASALDRFRRKVKKGGRNLEDLDDEARHEVRKAGKKLRYAADFFGSLYDRKRERRRYKRFSKELEAFQDRLGALNDLVSAPEVLERLGLSNDPDALALVAVESKPDLLEAAAEAHDALVDAKRFWR